MQQLSAIERVKRNIDKANQALLEKKRDLQDNLRKSWLPPLKEVKE